MTDITIHAAKTNLSKLIARVHEGEEIIICRGKTPVAKLTAIAPATSKRQFGAYKGLATVTDAFFEPLPDDEIRLWEGQADREDPAG